MYWVQTSYNLNNILTPKQILENCQEKKISQIVVGNEGPFEWLEFNRLSEKYKTKIIYSIYKKNEPVNILWLINGDVLSNAAKLEKAYEKGDFYKLEPSSYIPILIPSQGMSHTDLKTIKESYIEMMKAIGVIYIGETSENKKEVADLTPKSKDKVVPIQRVRFLDPVDKELSDLRRDINGEKNISNNYDLFLKPEKYMHEKFQSTKKMLDTIKTNFITNKTNQMELWNKKLIQETIVPQNWNRFFTEDISLPSSEWERKKIAMLCINSGRGFNWVYGSSKHRKQALNQLKQELTIIVKGGFYDYFLIIEDIVNFSKQKKIRIGRRGSVVSSVLAYCLGIVNLDPLLYNLKFERFINPHRSNKPDIDLEIPVDKLDTIHKYLYDKYGDNNISRVVSFNRFGVRNSIAYIRKYSGIEDKIENWIPKGIGSPEKFYKSDLSKAIENQFKKGGYARVFRLAKILSDKPMTSSIQQSSVIVSEGLNNVPTTIREEQRILQLTSNNSELSGLGFEKLDILPSNVLAIIEDTWRHLSDKDEKKFNYNDVNTYNMLSGNKQNFIFQLKSKGMKDTFKKVNPRNLSDIMDCLSLYRPGPKDELKNYLTNRKNGTYSLKNEIGKHIPGTEELNHIVESTNGIIIYQEQVMDIVKHWANYSLSEADLLRSIISNKDNKRMKIEKEKFIKRSALSGRSVESTKELYLLIEKFSEYGFPKSHAASYAMLTYETAYLKANHPREYLLAELRNSSKGFKRIKLIKNEAKRLGIAIEEPSLDKSEIETTIKNGKIILGILTISGIGENEALKIKELKYKDNGTFDTNGLKKDTIRILNESNFFD